MPEDADAKQRIAELREQVDAVDREIVKLLNRRAALALEIRAHKPAAHLSLYDPAREEEIFTRVAEHNDGPLYGDNVREIYEAILHVMKELRG